MKYRIYPMIIVLSTILLPVAAVGWGVKGHAMCARIALRRMPDDAPEFFRHATQQISYLSSEPDRWRGSASLALNQVNAPDHYFDLEAWGADPFPGSRYDMLMLAFRKGIVRYDPTAVDNRRGLPSNEKFVSDLGTAPYAVIETAAKLASNFRDWRDCPDDSDASRLVKRQIENDSIYCAGILAHYVTDLGNPLHCTVHFNGWAEGFPNPKNFPAGKAANEIHSRFESDYVNSAIEEKDIEPLISPPKRLDSSIADIEAFIRRNNGFVSRLYELDREGAFGSGREAKEAKEFVASRLADAASMMRDIWTSAWAASRQEWLNERVRIYPRPGKTVLQLLRDQFHITTTIHDGIMVIIGIGNRQNGIDGRIWRLYYNNKLDSSGRSVDAYIPTSDERIDLRFETPIEAPATH